MTDKFKRNEEGYIILDFQDLVVEGGPNSPQGPLGCIVSHRISKDGLKVGYMYREEGTKDYPDSGWRFFAGDESDDYTANADNFNINHLNTVANLDPDIIPYLKAPIGSYWIRVDESSFEEDTGRQEIKILYQDHTS